MVPIAGTMDRPYEWNFHLVTWVTLVLGVVVVVLGHRRLLRTSGHPISWARHDIEMLAGACCAALVALTWPVADLAAHWSLTALVIQRLILILAVAPMLLLGLPYDVLERITRPALVDAALNRCRRPATAIALVTALTVGSTVPPVVQAQATSPALRGLLAIATILAGLVLWIPVLGRVPGVPRLRPMMRFGYLAAQAVVPAFLSFVLILSPHPLYAVFAGSKAAIGLQPLNDQQIAGFVSKLTMLIVLLTVGGIGLAKAPSSSEEEVSLDEWLVWADVQRQFERADRRTLRPGRRGTPTFPPVFETPIGGGPPSKAPMRPDAHPLTAEPPDYDGSDP
jgi:cytochrome c oxidase assembly factor CtaG